MSVPPRIARDSPAFRRTTLALFSAGFSTFALMYCVQPLLPELAREFGVSAATSSLAVSLTTGGLAAALLITGGLSESIGRKRVIVASLAVAAVLTALSAIAPSWSTLLAMRTIIGVALAGVPAIAMAYVGEEIDPSAIGVAMGIYVAGTAFGGMVGRLLTAVLADAASWHVAVAGAAALGIVSAMLVWAILPGSVHFTRRPFSTSELTAAYGAQLRNARLGRLLAQGFLFMGTFMALFNYIGFRLLSPPYALSQATAGTIFLVYVVGMVSSPWSGAMVARIGRPRTLALNLAIMFAGVALTILSPLLIVGAGIAVMTFGFFAAHTVASSWVGHEAQQRKAQASSLYLFFYYLGASIAGALGGIFWERWQWNGVAAFLLVLVGIAIVLVPRHEAHEDVSATKDTKSTKGLIYPELPS